MSKTDLLSSSIVRELAWELLSYQYGSDEAAPDSWDGMSKNNQAIYGERAIEVLRFILNLPADSLALLAADVLKQNHVTTVAEYMVQRNEVPYS